MRSPVRGKSEAEVVVCAFGHSVFYEHCYGHLLRSIVR